MTPQEKTQKALLAQKVADTYSHQKLAKALVNMASDIADDAKIFDDASNEQILEVYLREVK